MSLGKEYDLNRSTLGLKQYNKDTPPGWRPRSYPFGEYTESLAIWLKMTKLDPEQIGSSLMSRLEAGALRLAKNSFCADVALRFELQGHGLQANAEDASWWLFAQNIFSNLH